jgi:transposase
LAGAQSNQKEILDMDYIRTEATGQLVFEQSTEFLHIPCCLYGFHNTETLVGKAASGRTVYCFQGKLDLPESERRCECGKRMHVNSHPDITLRHLCFGGDLSCLRFPHVQLRCSGCGAVREQFISFKAPGHMITDALYQYTRDLLAVQTYTNKQVAEITGLGKNTVKEIDKKRLQEKYTIDSKRLIKPDRQAKYLGIDEFKLHDGHRYATHIIDMETGHILWIAKGKTKTGRLRFY